MQTKGKILQPGLTWTGERFEPGGRVVIEDGRVTALGSADEISDR